VVSNPWRDIPLAEYEGHMSLPGIGQAEMLAEQFEALLTAHTPSSVAIIGCAGGNGLERISPALCKRIVGIDINPLYIAQAAKRFAKTLPGLELYTLDIEQPGLALPFEPVELVYAALIFEYVDLATTFENIRNMGKPDAVLATILQLPSASLATISPSPFSSLQALAPAMRLVHPGELQAQATQAGFELLSSRRLTLPSRKEFTLQTFRFPTAAPSAR